MIRYRAYAAFGCSKIERCVTFRLVLFSSPSMSKNAGKAKLYLAENTFCVLVRDRHVWVQTVKTDSSKGTGYSV